MRTILSKSSMWLVLIAVIFTGTGLGALTSYAPAARAFVSAEEPGQVSTPGSATGPAAENPAGTPDSDAQEPAPEETAEEPTTSPAAEGTGATQFNNNLNTPTIGGPSPVSPGALRSYLPTASNPGAAITLLPAYRWNYSGTLQGKFGGLEGVIINQTGSTFASGFFGIASVAWNVTLSLMNVAFTMDLVTVMTTQINEIFVTIADSLLTSGIVVVLGAVILFIAARSLLSGRLVKAISVFVLFAVPVAMLQLLATVTSGADEGEVPRWSPAWIASSGSALVNTVGGNLLMGLAGRVGAVAEPEDNYFNISAGENGAVDCRQYIATLNTRYDEFQRVRLAPSGSNASDDSTLSLMSSENGAVGRHGMLLISDMWQSAYLSNFVIAQYGDLDVGMQMVCKQLEIERGTPNAEMYAVVGGVYNGPSETQFVRPSGGAFAGWGPRPFIRYAQKINEAGAAQVYAWGACREQSGTLLGPGWRALGGEIPATAGEAITSEQCADWSRAAPVTTSDGRLTVDTSGDEGRTGHLLFNFDEGGFRQTGHIISPGKISDVIAITTPQASLPTEEAEALRDVGDLWLAYNGQNPMQRLISGALAMVGAFLYAWSFGLLSIGVIAAQVILVLALALLPVSLILAALPSESRQNNPGIRLLKLTGAMLLTKLVLTATLSLMIILTTVISRAGEGLLPGNAALVASFAPIVAFFILRFLLKKIGMGNITSIGGALGAVKGAAAQATGDRGAADGFRSQDGRGTAWGAVQKRIQQGTQQHRRKKAAVKASIENDRRREREKAAKEKAHAKTPAGKAEAKRDETKLRESQRRMTSNKSARKAKETGGFADLGSYIATSRTAKADGKHAHVRPDVSGRTSSFETRRVLDNAGITHDGLFVYKARPNAERRGKRLNQGFDKLSMTGEEGSNVVALTDAEMHEQERIAAEKTGVDVDKVQGNHLGLAPLVGSGANGEFTVVEKDGMIDYDATRAQAGMTTLMSPAANAIIADTASHLRELNIPGLDSGDYQRLAQHVVGHQMGLSNELGEQVDIFTAAGLSDKETKAAIEMAAQGNGKTHPKLQAFIDQMEKSITADIEQARHESVQNAEALLSRVTVSSVGSLDNLQEVLRAPETDIDSGLEEIRKMVEQLHNAQGKKGVDTSQIESILKARMEEMSHSLAGSLRDQELAIANVYASALRVEGMDPSELGEKTLTQEFKDQTTGEAIKPSTLDQALAEATKNAETISAAARDAIKELNSASQPAEALEKLENALYEVRANVSGGKVANAEAAAKLLESKTKHPGKKMGQDLEFI